MDLLGEISTRRAKFGCIAEKARENQQEVFTSLAHHLTEEFLLTSYQRLNAGASSGVDRMSCKEYGEYLGERISDLHQRLKSQNYQAPAIRRVWIDKGEGKQRPLGISTTEDKIVQRAVSDILNLIYEQDFYGFSYGFRIKRSAHQALQEIRNKLGGGKYKWIIDADIQGCFDNFDHSILRELLTQRVKDRSILKLIDQWLKAGVIDGNSFTHNTRGTPQGNIISPLLCNMYLHNVLDKWITETVKPLLKGDIFIIRFADDFVIGLEYLEDAQRVFGTLPKRMQKYGLTIHPEKSQLIRFQPNEKGVSPTFDFTHNYIIFKGVREGFAVLGFTHYWAISQKGYNVVKRRTSKKKMQKALKLLRESCKSNRHESLKEQCQKLGSKLRGLYQYYGIRGNYMAISRMYREAERAWCYWLNKRSQRTSYTWKGYFDLMKIFPLPPPHIVHKYV